MAAVLFEPYGTLIDVETDERDWYAFLNLSRFLEYRGVRLSADELRWLWFEKLARQTREGDGPWPEADVRLVWREILDQNGSACHHPPDLDPDAFLADVVTLHRALTRRTLRLMDGARVLLDELHGRVHLGVVSDTQMEYVVPELRITDIARYFATTQAAGAYRFRKPDQRLFRAALTALGVSPEQAVFVGCDTGRDVAGAAAAGMRTVLVLTPYGSKDIALGEPDIVIDHSADLLPAIKHLLDV